MSSRTDWPKVASYLLLEKDGKFMLIRRFNTGWQDGNFTLPAGHVNSGESAQNTIIREAKEEVGITINSNDLELAHIIHRNKTSDNAEYIDFYFKTKKWLGDPVNGESVDLIEWHSPNDLPVNIIPVVKEVLAKIYQGILYSDTGWS